MKLDNPLVVQWEYASEERLAARNHAYRQLVEGLNAEEVSYEAVAEVSPARVLEVGCGLGEIAARIQRELRADVRAIDISERMVELTRERGVQAEVGDAQALAFADGEFDCVVANWVLYHVPDVDLAVREIARVLKPGGRLVAGTLGANHMVELWEMLGGTATSGLSFDHDTGGAALEPYFAKIERRDANGTIVFPDAAAMRAFVAATTDRSHLATNVPELEGPFRARSAHTVFVATKA
jgi:SAM-dependent methyltransferase